MDCPACTNVLTTMTAGRITVDACERGCGGLWFDRYELMKVDEADESTGEGLLEIEQDPNLRVDLSKRLNCPKDPDVVMMRHFSNTNFPNAQRPRGPARAQPLRDRRRGAGGRGGTGPGGAHLAGVVSADSSQIACS